MIQVLTLALLSLVHGSSNIPKEIYTTIQQAKFAKIFTKQMERSITDEEQIYDLENENRILRTQAEMQCKSIIELQEEIANCKTRILHNQVQCKTMRLKHLRKMSEPSTITYCQPEVKSEIFTKRKNQEEVDVGIIITYSKDNQNQLQLQVDETNETSALKEEIKILQEYIKTFKLTAEEQSKQILIMEKEIDNLKVSWNDLHERLKQTKLELISKDAKNIALKKEINFLNVNNDHSRGSLNRNEPKKFLVEKVIVKQERLKNDDVNILDINDVKALMEQIDSQTKNKNQPKTKKDKFFCC